MSPSSVGDRHGGSAPAGEALGGTPQAGSRAANAPPRAPAVQGALAGITDGAMPFAQASTAVASISTRSSEVNSALTPISVTGGTGVSPNVADARSMPFCSAGILSMDQSTT